MSRIVCIDLQHLGLPGAIGSYLVHGPAPALVDPGPTPTLDALLEGLRAEGVGPSDLRHILLTHVHLDHAGATGHLMEIFPRATVLVHEDGAPHMADPERLVASTRRTFGEAHDRLWGDVRPVPAARIRGWRPGEAGPWKGLRPLATPGHIAHHVAYLDEEDGTLLAGDAMGIVLDPGAPTHPPTPPPGVDVAAWSRTLSEIASVGPERFGAAHFGFHGEPVARARELNAALLQLERRVAAALARDDASAADAYEEEVRSRLAEHRDRELIDRYFDTFPAATDWAGMRLYLERKGTHA